jgi:VWFA-related protein
VGTSYLVFLDNFFAPIPRDRDQVLRGMLEQIGDLGPRDRMAFVIFHRRRIELVSSWTSSRREIEGAIQRMMGGAGGGVLGVGRTILSGPESGSTGAAMQELDKALERVVRGVNATLRGFAAAPGRKVMLLLSGGWPQDPCVYLQGQVTPLQRGIECDNTSPLIWRSLYETANLLGYTLYPIDVGPGSQSGASTLREAEIHSTLRTLAVATGGLPLINATRHLALERVIEDTRSYYWLGFTPDWRGDDKRRKIRLEILRPGLELRYRETFRDLSRSQEMDFLVEGVLLFGGELPAAGKLPMTLGTAERRGLRMELPLRLTIPMDEVVMLPHQGRYMAELELRVGALGPSGDMNEIAAVPVVLEGDTPPPKGSHAVYEVAIKLRRKPQDLVVSLYDPIGDRMLVAGARFEP